MANQKQLKLLRQDVQAWNRWLEKKTYDRLDLIDADLIDADLTGANLSGANLSGANLSGANFDGASLINANLGAADLRGADFTSANLNGANLSKAYLKEAYFREANLINANLSGANLGEADLIGAYLSGADLIGANLSGADFSSAHLNEANLSGAHLINANLRGAHLIKANLGAADLTEAYLSEANLSEAYLNQANLTEAYLNQANLTEANLSEADLTEANLSEAYLNQANLNQANLRGADLSSAFLNDADLNGANLRGAHLNDASLMNADLIGANLSEADLSEANLRGANLKGAHLFTATALHTNFRDATLTGACIQDWNTNADTTLEGVVCDFVYLKHNQQERRPSDPHQTFALGEFTKLFQKAQATLDLIFRHGVDWQAFTYAFQQLQIENEADELAIASIENKGDGVVVIRIKAAPTADRPKLHGDFMQVYEVVHKTLESQYQARLEDKDKHINQLFALVQDYQAQDTEIKKLMAENPAPKFNFNAPVGSVADTIQAGGRQQAIQHNYASEPQQTLAAAAAEIQALLQQLEQANPTATDADQKAFVNAALPTTTRDRILGAAQGGGLAWLEGTPYGKITKAIIEGWQKPSK
ncbi:pentapeptide repeat-containing protein [Phormidium sp. FACHB-592]|uniref:Pentapeptide repeat-containing protein n=1 Tax=Stenomitos frigidus AS-A4 TaxID=2933935 RepID=A0ABV0KSL2_9CYAN|nr:pentapeptide repeat-containing protein [Phormidium sp. FACHB-592]MBD2077241.1 pentapeptide repeat-containing protein [Phormidium sp. FACHB-592]